MNIEEVNKFFFEFYNLNKEYHSYNPFLRVSKATNSKIKAYKKNKFNQEFFKVKYIKFCIPPFFVLRLISNTIYNILLYLVYKKPKKEITKVNTIFLSHLTNRNIDVNEDSFFGNLPDEIIKTQKTVGIIYSNQIRAFSRSIIRRKEISNNIVISKYLKTCELIAFYLQAYRSMKFTLKKSKELTNLDENHDFLISKACFSFLTIESMMNFHLIEETKSLISKYEPEHVFLTAEGHIYENAIYLYCLNQIKIKKVFLFQNSPIVSCQFGLFDFIKNNQKKLFYLVQGIAYKNLFEQFNPSANVAIVGKKGLSLEKKQGEVKDFKLLLVPDGDKNNIYYFLDQMKKLNKDISSNISISLHPDTYIGLTNQLKLRYLRRKGILNKLYLHLKDSDLDDFSIVGYTSSSLAIKSLLLGKQLIYMSNSHYNLDPLWLINQGPTKEVSSVKFDFSPSLYMEEDVKKLYSELSYKTLLHLIEI
jgi:hypothetical protein